MGSSKSYNTISTVAHTDIPLQRIKKQDQDLFTAPLFSCRFSKLSRDAEMLLKHFPQAAQTAEILSPHRCFSNIRLCPVENSKEKNGRPKTRTPLSYIEQRNKGKAGRFFQFSEVGGLAIIHRRIEPHLARGQTV
jgi:hypothetical protein